MVLLLSCNALILAQIKADEDTKKLAQSLKLRAKDAEPAPAPAAPAAPAAEGMQYLGASLNVVPDHTGSASRDSLAEQYRKNMETETLVEAGREPNLYFVPQSRNSASAASAAASLNRDSAPTGVLSSWETFATKSRLTDSTRVTSETSRRINRYRC